MVMHPLYHSYADDGSWKVPSKVSFSAAPQIRKIQDAGVALIRWWLISGEVRRRAGGSGLPPEIPLGPCTVPC